LFLKLIHTEGGSLEARYLEMCVSENNSTDPCHTLLEMDTFGLDDFEDSLFMPSSESLGVPGLESSKSRRCSSQQSYSWTSIQQMSSDQNYGPVAGYTYSSNKNVQNPRRIFQNPETQCNIVQKDIGRHSKRKSSSMLITFGQNEEQYSSGCADKVTNIAYLGGQASPPEVSWASRSVAAERTRRRKVNELLMSLRALVPNVSKMDKSSIISDAVDYIQSLQKQMKETGVDICALQSNTVQLSRSSTSQPISSSRPIESVDVGDYEKRPTKSQAHQCFKILELDVNKVEEKTFLVRISCKKEPGAVTHFLEALESFELDIINASHITLKTCILITVLAEAVNWELMQEKEIKKNIVEVASKYGFQEA